MEKTPKRRYIFYSVIGIIILAVGAVLMSMNLLNKSENQSGELDQLADTQDSADSQQSVEPESFRKFDDRTVKILRYEMFHRDPAFYSNEEVEYYSLSETIKMYSLFHHLEQHGHKWDDARRDQIRERIRSGYEYDKKDPVLNAYLKKMFHVLRITEEEYIEHYLLVNKEYEMLHWEMFNKNIGLDEDGGYAFMDAEMEYKKLAGISQLQLMKLSERMPERLEPMDPQPDLPFLKDSYLSVTTNDEGEYIFVTARHIRMFMSEQHGDLYSELKFNVVNEDLTRNTLERYKEAVASYENDDPQKMETAKELGQILEILERSIKKKLF
ncbi:hypothetical protein [Ureibacillus manganicus]|uniref:Uncharacterized protein n=1 Tax=Ureibacillus manganicus DSM 26584 TaxID=1384049 RepID=A0A0A3I2Q4_9BACL|nr:hypothetical protein [Ureibacillus manganicus]KGR78999.1 hypothetical protein CD29_08255 [Ureibacillus manganicus DSM 26584]